MLDWILAADLFGKAHGSSFGNIIVIENYTGIYPAKDYDHLSLTPKLTVILLCYTSKRDY
jgi:hypothetical protein